jgi:hypothetical protein
MATTRVLRAITICQPYAHLIATPTEQLPGGLVRKRVENRTWFCAYRGPIAIHAGKSRKFMRSGDLETFPSLVFGAVLGIAEMVACVKLRNASKPLPAEFHWLRSHVHAEGPYCFVLERFEPLKLPYYCSGKQGLWNAEIPEELI